MATARTRTFHCADSLYADLIAEAACGGESASSIINAGITRELRRRKRARKKK